MTRARFLAASLVLPLGFVLLHAQQQEQQPQQPVFRAGATLVRVDATVIDRDGAPVTSLTADDFEIEEDGVPQKVEACKLVSADGKPPAGDDVSLTIRSQEHAAAEAARDDVRVFLIFWDEYHIDQFASALRARDALTQFVTSAFGPTDLIALMDPLTPVDALEFTRDHQQLSQHIHDLKGRLDVYMPTRSAAEEAMLERGDVPRLRTDVVISALKSAAVHLGSLKEGRKSIIFVSDGFPLRGDQTNDVQDLIQTANNNNTAIITLDPQGLSVGVSDVLRMLADNTGADAIVNANEPLAPLKQVVKEASAYYLLGYTPTRSPADDGRFHQIRVRLKKGRYDVRARRGYWAPSEADIAKAARETAAAEVPENISQALGALSAARPEQTLDVWTGASLGEEGHTQVSVAWTPRPAHAAATRGGTFSVSMQAPGGKQTADAPIEAGRLSVLAPAGSLPLEITVRDANGDVVEQQSRVVTVPNFSAPGLALASPVVFRAQNITEFRALSAAADPLPFAGHEFVRTDRLLIRFALYGDAAKAAVSARLLSSKQSMLVALPATPVAGSPGVYQIDLPLASVARGDYLISIEAAADDQRATALVPLRVVS